MMKNKLLSLLIIFTIIFTNNGKTQSMEVLKAVSFDVSIPLRDIKPLKQPIKKNKFKKEGSVQIIPNRFKAVPLTSVIDNVVQKDYSKSTKDQLSTPIMNFEGLNNSNNLWRINPPDPAGDVGPNHYVQVVNCMLKIFNKSGVSLYGPVPTSTLWNGFSGAWDGHNDGDGIVLYDENADRWLISQFAWGCEGTPETNFQLIAISTSPDPTGSYYRYAFEFDYMPDYPKLGIWHDGYYLSMNRFETLIFSDGFVGVGACAMERSKMLVGDATAKMIYFKTETIGGTGSSAGSNCQSMLPSDCDGTFPPNGTPNYFVYDSQDGNSSELRIWALKANWDTLANSTFSYVTKLDVAPFNYIYSVPQIVLNKYLDGLSDRLMFRNQYRNFGSYETFVTCRNVSASYEVAGIRWYEYRKMGSTFSLHQQSTFAPDNKSRWMGSIAMNADGDIGIAYSVSGNDINPSIYYTGRKANDPLNQLTIPEGIIQTGTVSLQDPTFTVQVSRWGDYTTINIDPSDNQTFWTTQEYVGSYGGDFPWATKIASFKFDDNPSIVVFPTNLSFGNVKIGTTSAPQSYSISGANLTSNIIITAPNGYLISTTSGGTYTNTLTLNQTSGYVNTTTIYVKFSPTSLQSYNGNITNVSTGATTLNLAVSGNGSVGIEENIANKFNINVFPNPFTNKTTIEYTITETQNVELSVIDITGKELIKLKNEKQNKGKQTVDIDAQKISTGIYFYKLKVGDKQQVGKLIKF